MKRLLYLLAISSLIGILLPSARLHASCNVEDVNCTSTLIINADPTQNPSVIGDTVGFIASVSANNGIVDGTVSFSVQGQNANTYSPISGCEDVALQLVGSDYNADCDTNALQAGINSVKASFTPSAQSSLTPSSSILNQQVLAPTDTTTSVTSSQNPSVVGQSVTFKASASDDSGPGTIKSGFGTMSFNVDGNPVASCADLELTADGNVPGSPEFVLYDAACTINFGQAGNHAVTVDYSGDEASLLLPSTGQLTQTVNAPATGGSGGGTPAPNPPATTPPASTTITTSSSHSTSSPSAGQVVADQADPQISDTTETSTPPQPNPPHNAASIGLQGAQAHVLVAKHHWLWLILFLLLGAGAASYALWYYYLSPQTVEDEAESADEES